MRKSSQVLSFSKIDKNNLSLIGGLGANLGEMAQAGFPIPNGFILSSLAYLSFIKENNLAPRIKHLLSTAHFERADSLMQVSFHIKKLILDGNMSEDLIKEIFFAYRKLSGLFRNALVSIKSSETTNNPQTYFVKGDANLLLKIKESWASHFEPNALLHRHNKKIDHFNVGIAIIVQKMLKPSRSGVMFTVDPVTNDKTTIVIEAGKGKPDHYKIQKHNLLILLKKVDPQNKYELSHKQIIDLALLGKKIEQHYYFPQVIQWAIEGRKIYIIKRHIFTNIIHQSNSVVAAQEIPPTHRLKMLLKGDSAFPGIATGPVKLVRTPKELNTVMRGDILVTKQTNSDYLPAMKKAAVIITELGGRASHAAIVGRQLGKPTIIGTKNATKVLKPAMIVTVNGKRGEINKVSALCPLPK